MALQFPARGLPTWARQCFDLVAKQFPVGPENMRSVIVEKVSELPVSGEEAQLLYNEADDTLYYFNGTEWKT